jgi:alcohol/geraniol dehydrogenase (NADP+)
VFLSVCVCLCVSGCTHTKYVFSRNLAGLGGLGQMGIKIAKAMGCIVTAVSRSEGKRKFAMDCGATGFVSSSDSAAMSAVMSLLTSGVLNSLAT